jgi:predicted transglutaminase-like cysteine proteinase
MISFPFGKIDWQLVYRINEQINRLRLRPDLALYGSDKFWGMAASAGPPLHDPVLAKRHWMVATAALDWYCLQPATGTRDNGDPHAVLLIDTTHGDYVFDTITNDILPRANVRMDWYGRADWQQRRWHPMDDPAEIVMGIQHSSNGERHG